ncbi:MAG: FtsX-like permease family protein [Anaerostipes sp.]|uniref:FtsX-like permease family protein n=1 Tax=Anaerostipes sp. TaxID=1872530 RepID=UPI003990FE1A
MKKTALHKDIYRTISRTLPRFLSIFFIVILGVAFFSGIRVTEKDMYITADRQFDQSCLMDIKLVGTMGLSEDNLKAVKELTETAGAEGGYSVDAICRKKGNLDEYAMQVKSQTEQLNQMDVVKGRLPKSRKECLVDEMFAEEHHIGIGDVITLSSGKEEALTDTLKDTEYTVTGIGRSSEYLSRSRGSTDIGSGTINGFLVVSREEFLSDIYTEIYITAKGAKDERAYESAYNQKVSELEKQLKQIQKDQNAEHLIQIKKEAEDKIKTQESRYQKERKKALNKLERAEKKLQASKKTIEKAEKELQDNEDQLEEGERALTVGKNQYETGKRQIADAKKQIASAGKKITSQEKKLKASEETLKKSEKQLDTSEKEIKAAEAKLQDSEEKLLGQEKKLKELEEQIKIYEQSLGADHPTVQNLKKQLESGKKQVLEGKQKLSQEKSKLLAAKKQISSGRAQIASSRAKISAGKKELRTARKKLIASQKSIQSKEKELKEAKRTLKQSEKQLTSGKKRLAEGKKEIQAAQKEWKSGQKAFKTSKAAAMRKLKNGQEKIKEAREEVEDLKAGKWYILNREKTQSYVEYGEEAKRIAALSQVVPVIFFLVAALVSLTAMTRMVEEQRTQIGIFKALGYSGFHIALKYVSYALAATVSGSVLGAVIGEKLLPWIIITAYKMMYVGLGEVQTPLDIEYSFMAAFLAVGVVVAAVLSACYKELREKPAKLMRPTAPKEGKRILLERIGFLWRRMNFIWKATMRNLFRYKKRFFMTIFGIGGCMSLLLVGFGIKDSISAISENQYEKILTYDFSVSYKDGAAEEDKENLKNWISEKKGIQDFMEVKETTVTISANDEEQEATRIVPMSQKSFSKYITLRDRVGGQSYKMDDQGVILTEKAATLLDVAQGDQIQIREPGGKTVTVEIRAVTENYMLHKVYMTKSLYEKLYGEEAQSSGIYCIQNQNVPQNQDQIGKEVLSRKEAASVAFSADEAETMSDMVDNLNIVVVVLIVSAGLLAFVVLYNLNNINISERRMELATIKVLGFYDGEVNAYVCRENILLTIFGIIAGAVMGTVLHRYVIFTTEVDLIMFGRNINFSSYIYSILLTIGFAVFVNVLMYFQLRGIDMVESLKSTE